MLAVNDRYCAREAKRVGRNADRNMYEVSLDAIVAVGGRNGFLEVEREVVMRFNYLSSALVWHSFDWPRPGTRCLWHACVGFRTWSF